MAPIDADEWALPAADVDAWLAGRAVRARTGVDLRTVELAERGPPPTAWPAPVGPELGP